MALWISLASSASRLRLNLLRLLLFTMYIPLTLWLLVLPVMVLNSLKTSSTVLSAVFLLLSCLLTSAAFMLAILSTSLVLNLPSL